MNQSGYHGCVALPGKINTVEYKSVLTFLERGDVKGLWYAHHVITDMSRV